MSACYSRQMQGSQIEQWKQSKFTIDGSTIRGTRDRRELWPGSRIVADLVGQFYSNAIPKWVSGDLADLGCGKAPLLGAYRDRCTSVALADWPNSAHPNPLINISVDLNEPLVSIPDKSYDVVVLSDVLEHIREPVVLMSEISRILRPGGRLLMNVPFAYWIHEAPYDYYRYTRYALESFVETAGMQVVELTPLGGWIEVMADMSCKLLTRARLTFVASALHRAVIAFNNTGIGRRLALSTGDVLPLGYGMVARKPLAG